MATAMTGALGIERERQVGPEAFFSILANEMGDDGLGGGSEEVVNIEGAAHKLSEEVNRAWLDNYEGKLTDEAYQAVIDKMVAEIDERTCGLLFRLDVPGVGPMFVMLPLWRFAGRCGPEMGPGDEPTWDGNWQDYEGDEEAFKDPDDEGEGVAA